MALFFNQLYVDTLSKALLSPGEQLVASASGTHAPWWTMGIPQLGSQYLVLATDRRAVLVRHKRGWITGDRMEEVKSVAWNQVQNCKMSGLFAAKKLDIKGGDISLTLSVRGGFAQPAGNIEGTKKLVDTWQRTKALPG